MSRRGLPAGLSMRHDAHYVDELTQAGPSHVGRLIPIDRLDPNPNQPRTEIGDLTELTASIREKGVLEPLLVKPAVMGRWTFSTTAALPSVWVSSAAITAPAAR